MATDFLRVLRYSNVGTGFSTWHANLKNLKKYTTPGAQVRVGPIATPSPPLFIEETGDLY